MKKFLLALMMSCCPLVAFQGFYIGGSLGGHLAEGAQVGEAVGTYTMALQPSTSTIYSKKCLIVVSVGCFMLGMALDGTLSI